MIETIVDWTVTAAIVGGPLTIAALYLLGYRTIRGHYPPRHNSPHQPR